MSSKALQNLANTFMIKSKILSGFKVFLKMTLIDIFSDPPPRLTFCCSQGGNEEHVLVLRFPSALFVKKMPLPPFFIHQPVFYSSSLLLQYRLPSWLKPTERSSCFKFRQNDNILIAGKRSQEVFKLPS